MVHLAEVDAATDEIVPGGVDVFDREAQPVNGSRLSRSEALAELDRGLRVVGVNCTTRESSTPGQVGVKPPPQALISPGLSRFDRSGAPVKSLTSLSHNHRLISHSYPRKQAGAELPS